MLRPGDPARIGPYELLDRLGSGGQGIVYLARASADSGGELVAVKLMRSRLAEQDEARVRFLREIEVARHVADFCTARVLDAGEGEDSLYVVSEYIPGPSLQKSVDTDGPRAGAALQRVAVGTATALAAIHEAGIVHRDFKPGNVLLGPDGPRVIDFGISRALDASVSLTSGVVGTPTYMSPEQIAGERAGPPSDVFSWAVTMVFAATGRPAFGDDTIPAVLNRILNQPPDLSGVPEELRVVLADCLAKDPAARPSASQLLLRLIASRPSTPAPGSTPTPRPVPVPVSTPPPGSPAPFSPAPLSPAPFSLGPVRAAVVATDPSRTGRRVRYGVLAVAGALAVGAAVVAPAWLDPGASTGRPVASSAASPGASVPVSPDASASASVPSSTPSVSPSGTPAPSTGPLGPSTGKAMGAMSGHRDDVEAVAVAQVGDSQLVVSGSRDRTVRLWDLATRRALATLTGHRSWVRDVAVTELAGEPVAVSAGDDGTVRLWDLTARKALGPPIDTGEPVFSLAVADVDGKPVAATGGRDGTLRVWDLTTRKQIGEARKAHNGAVFGLALATYDGASVIFSGGSDGLLKLWPLEGGEARVVAGNRGQISVVTTAELDGDLVVLSGGGDQDIRVDDPAGGEVRLPYEGHSGWVYSLAVQQVGPATVVVSGGNDMSARVHDLATGKEIGKPFTGHQHNVFGATTATLDGRIVAVTAGGENVVRVWRIT